MTAVLVTIVLTAGALVGVVLRLFAGGEENTHSNNDQEEGGDREWGYGDGWWSPLGIFLEEEDFLEEEVRKNARH